MGNAAYLLNSLLDEIPPHLVVHLQQQTHCHLATTAPDAVCN
jgi:hypothetical protein